MLLKELIAQAREILEIEYGKEEAASMVSVLFYELCGIRPYQHVTEPGAVVSDEDERKIRAALQRLSRWEPIQYVIGSAEFYGRRFRVCQDVLIPRNETELLCRMVVDKERRNSSANRRPRILDLCTGSGCIAWTLAAELPGAEVCAVDISENALSVARSQQIDCQCAPQFFVGDVLRPGSLRSLGEFDIIVSNPPYVTQKERALMRRNVLDYEPGLALFVPDEDPLKFYRAIAAVAHDHMRENSYSIVEINESLGPATAMIFKDLGYRNVQVTDDLFNKNRFVSFEK